MVDRMIDEECLCVESKLLYPMFSRMFDADRTNTSPIVTEVQPLRLEGFISWIIDLGHRTVLEPSSLRSHRYEISRPKLVESPLLLTIYFGRDEPIPSIIIPHYLKSEFSWQTIPKYEQRCNCNVRD